MDKDLIESFLLKFEADLCENFKALARSVPEGMNVVITEDNTIPEKLSAMAKITLQNILNERGD